MFHNQCDNDCCNNDCEYIPSMCSCLLFCSYVYILTACRLGSKNKAGYNVVIQLILIFCRITTYCFTSCWYSFFERDIVNADQQYTHGKILLDTGWNRDMSPNGTLDRDAQIASLSWIRTMSLDPLCVESQPNHDPDVKEHTIILDA